MGFVDFGLDYGNLDFVYYVEVYGVYGYWVDSVEGFLLLLECCLGMFGVYVIDCLVDYLENDCIFNVELCECVLVV